MLKSEKRNLVLSGNLYKGLLILALPIMFNNLIQTLYNLVDSYWLGQLGTNDVEVAAVSIVWPIPALVLAFGNGIYVAGASLMSQNIGAGNKERAKFIAGQLFSFAIILGFLFMIIGFIGSPLILNLMKLESELYDASLSYLRIIFLETPIVFTLFVFTSMRQANGDTLTPVIFTMISALLNMVLDPIFIIYLGLRVSGVAYATVLSKLILVPIWLFIAFYSKKGISLSITNMKLQFSSMFQIFRVAIPASIGQAINSAGFIVMNGVVASYGTFMTAAFSVGNKFNNLIMMPALGIGSALSFFIGQNVGNGNIKRARDAFKASLILTLATMLIGMSIILPYPVRKYLVEQFLNEPESIALAIEYMFWVVLNAPLMGFYQNFTGVFQGAGKTMYSLYMSIIRLWGVRIPILIVFTLLNVGNSTIWISMIASNAIVCILGLIIYKFGNWQRKII